MDTRDIAGARRRRSRAAHPSGIWQIGDSVLDPSRSELSSAAGSARLRPTPLRLLLYLVENRDRIVSQDEILGAVWRRTAATDVAFSTALRDLRRALGDDASNPRYVQTLRGHGYRLIADTRPGGSAVDRALDRLAGTIRELHQAGVEKSVIRLLEAARDRLEKLRRCRFPS